MERFLPVPSSAMLRPALLLLIVSVWRGAAQQDPGMGYPPQLFYLAPSAAAVLQTQPSNPGPGPGPGPGVMADAGKAQAGKVAQAAAFDRMVPPVAVAQGRGDEAGHRQEQGQEQEQEQELGQFHSWDARGRAVFGYLLPDQTRVEHRAEDGSVRGAYSYRDQDGRAIKVHYWDSGDGFHTAGNHLPVATLGLPLPVKDTPEVEAAREQHLKQVQAALLQHTQLLDRLEKEKKQQQQLQLQIIEQQKHEQQKQEQQQGSQQPLQQGQQGQQQGMLHKPVVQHPYPFEPPQSDALDSDTLVVESDGHQEDVGSSSLDDSADDLTRYPDLHLLPPQALYDPTHVHDPSLEAVIVEADPDAGARASFDANALVRMRGRPGARAKALHLGKTEEILEENKKQEESKKEKEKEKEKEKPAVNAATTVVQKSPSGSFYMFWHSVPTYVEVKTVGEESSPGKSEQSAPSTSQKATLAHAHPPAAVHLFQTPPALRTKGDFGGTAPLPLFLPHHDATPMTYSAKADFFHAIPVAAVHDTQVHPFQQGALPNFQLRPVLLPGPEDAH